MARYNFKPILAYQSKSAVLASQVLGNFSYEAAQFLIELPLVRDSSNARNILHGLKKPALGFSGALQFLLCASESLLSVGEHLDALQVRQSY